MAFFFTEQQMVEAARKAYREHSAMDAKHLAEWSKEGPISLPDWTDSDTELDQLGEALKDELAAARVA